jgi:multiple sugar transport system substrate-binding protein
MDAMWLGWMFGARWFNGDGSSGFSSDAKWAKAFTWQKNFIAQVYGGGNYETGMKKVQKFVAGAGDFWGGDNDFVKGRVAMMTFADWMSQMFCDLDWNLNPCTKPVVNFGVSPIPVDSSIVSSNYGSGPVGGALMGISKGSKNVKDAWIVLKGLATDTELSLALSNMTGSVPSLTSVLKSPNLKFPAFYKAWFDIAGHPKSGWHQLRNTGEHEEEKEANDFMAAWQAGQVSNLKTGLASVTQAINTILSKNHA